MAELAIAKIHERTFTYDFIFKSILCQLIQIEASKFL